MSDSEFFSRTVSLGDGSTTSFPLTFTYLTPNDVRVSIQAPDQDEPEIYTGNIVFLNSALIQLDSAPVSGAIVVRYRQTDEDNLEAILHGGSTLQAAELNVVLTQLLFLIQEAVDANNQAALTYADYPALGPAFEAFALNEVIGPIVVTRVSKLEAGAAGCRASLLVPATGSNQVFTIYKNLVANFSDVAGEGLVITSIVSGSAIGTITVAEGTKTPVFSVPVDVGLAPGDTLSLVTTTDGNLVNFTITFRLKRL